MTENKRFILIDGVKRGTHSGIWDNLKQHNQGSGDELWVGEVLDLLNRLCEKKSLCNYIQRKLNESYIENIEDFNDPAFSSGYKSALFDIKKGLMKRDLWEINVEEHEFTKISTNGWIQCERKK